MLYEWSVNQTASPSAITPGAPAYSAPLVTHPDPNVSPMITAIDARTSTEQGREA
jgi:hypothetical protein